MVIKQVEAVTTERTKYICSDGTEFYDEDAANTWEFLLSISDIRITSMNNVVPFFDDEANMVDYAWFRLNSESDYDKMVKYYEYMYRDCNYEEYGVMDRDYYESVVNLVKPEHFPYPYYCVKEGDNACCGFTMEDIKNGAKKFFDRIGVEISFPE